MSLIFLSKVSAVVIANFVFIEYAQLTSGGMKLIVGSDVYMEQKFSALGAVRWEHCIRPSCKQKNTSTCFRVTDHVHTGPSATCMHQKPSRRTGQ